MPRTARVFDDARIRELLAQGVSHSAIARQLGIPKTTLHDHLQRGGHQDHQGRPASEQHAQAQKTPGPPEGPQGRPEAPPQGALGPPWGEIVAAWPQLHAMLIWWQERHAPGPDAGEKLARVTYHVAPRWIAAVKREADQTGDSYAAVVNRALRQYFAGRGT